MTVQKTEKRSFSVFDVFLILLAALAVSLAVYFFTETPYGVNPGKKPVYRLTMQGTLADWEEELIPAERQRILNENNEPTGRITAVSVDRVDGRQILRLKCEWEGDLPSDGKTFRLETSDLVKTMRITEIAEISEGRA